MANIGPSTTEMPTNQVSVYPKHMAYYSKRLNGFSKNTVRLNTQSSSTVSQNGIISITLPSNSIVDLKSLAMFFQCLPVVTDDAAGTDTGRAVYPRFTTSIVERIQVSIGGVGCGNAPNMNSAISYLKQIATLSADKADSQPSLWSSPQGYLNGAAGVVRGAGANQANWQRGPQQATPVSQALASSAMPCMAVGANGNTLEGNFANEARYCLELFNGFISESQPAYLDTSALGAIRMDILLSPSSVFMGLGAAGLLGGTIKSYTLSDIYCYVDVISVADGIYNSALASYLAQGQSLKIPFTNYFNFVDTIAVGGFNTSMRVNVRSQNIRRVWNSWRKADYNSGASGLPAQLANSATTPYFQFGTVNNNSFQSLQLQINNVSVPSTPALAGTEIAYYNRKALNKMNNQLGASIGDCYVDERMSRDLFYSVIGLDDRLSNGLRTLSGYSSAGTQTSIYVNLTQTATPNTEALQHLCVVECVSMLLVGQNRQITVIS